MIASTHLTLVRTEKISEIHNEVELYLAVGEFKLGSLTFNLSALLCIVKSKAFKLFVSLS